MTDYNMPAGFYIHKRDKDKKKMRLVTFSGKQGHFQISKNGREVMLIGIEAMEHVDPPDDYLEWNKVYEKPEKRTVTNIAQEALDNFGKMTDRMASIANGNDKEFSKYWPVEEDLFPPIREYLIKNRELQKELEGMYNNYV